MSRIRIFSIFAVMFLSACSAGAANTTPTQDANVLATSVFSTAVAASIATGVAMHSATPTVTATRTPALPTLSPTMRPTIQPIDGVTNINVTVRSDSRKKAQNLGGLYSNQGVKVIARNDAATWYYIVWDKSPTGAAWVLAATITLKNADVTDLAIVDYDTNGNIVVLPPLLWPITGTPLPPSTPAAGAISGTINQLANVRVGPGPGYATMGSLNAGTVVTITGRISDNSWLQIGYPSGPDGHGWISADLVQSGITVGGLPFYNGFATPITADQAKNGGDEPTADPNMTVAPTEAATQPPAGPTGKVINASQLIVHSGPASSFAMLGNLKLDDPVVVTAETINKLWYRIVYASGSDGYGWVSTQYIQITGGDMTKLPFLDNLGNPLPKP